MVAFGNKIQDEDARDDNVCDAAEKSLAACAFEKIHRPVNNNPDEEQFDADDPPIVVGDSPEVIDEGLHPFRTPCKIHRSKCLRCCPCLG